MAPVPTEGLTVSTLISAKGSELKFWISKANEAADGKVLKFSGKVDELRASLASYYGLDLTVNPTSGSITVPTIDQNIRDRQWDDLEALGVEWKETVTAGRVFKLKRSVSAAFASVSNSIIAASQIDNNDSNPFIHAAIASNMPGQSANLITLFPSASLSANQTPGNSVSTLPVSEPVQIHSHAGTTDIVMVPFSQPSAPQLPIAPIAAAPAALEIPSAPSVNGDHQAGILQDLSAIIIGLERAEGLRDVIQQIESGAVQKIRDCYGPIEGRRGTADATLWPRYSGLVSKRERLARILENDFGKDKDHFFTFFSTPPPTRKKRKRTDEESSTSITTQEHFRSFRRIIKAQPWCEADLAVERRKAEYMRPDGEFSHALWDAKWGGQNAWEIWRAIGGERYEKKKPAPAETSNTV